MPTPNLAGTREQGFGADGWPMPSADLVHVARAMAGNRLLLSFSGRDSLAAWLFLRDRDFEVIPYWSYMVPHLSYDDQMLVYYERELGAHIIRLPHPLTYWLLRRGAWQTPDTATMLKAANLAVFDFASIEAHLAKHFGLGDNYLSAVGIKAADNLMRLRLIRQMGPIGQKRRRYYYAVWDWKTADVKAYIQRHGLKLSRCYSYWGSTGDGIEYGWLAYLRDHLPDDFQKVLDLFPLADLELYRYEHVA
jgi:hypothetical protein